MNSSKKDILLFSISVLLISSLICFFAYKLENLNLAILTVFTPTIIALILTAQAKGKKGLKELFIKQSFKKPKPKWFIFSIVVIPVIASVAMLINLGFDFSKFELRTTQLLPQLIIIFLIAIGEEYGWRGFLLPRLMVRYSAFYSNIIVGLIWGIWHLPAYLIGTGVPLEMHFAVFLLWVLLGSLFIGWIYYYTGSVLTAILIHISANATFNYLPILPEFTASMNTFSYFLICLSVLIFIIYYSGREDLIKGYSKDKSH